MNLTDRLQDWIAARLPRIRRIMLNMGEHIASLQRQVDHAARCETYHQEALRRAEHGERVANDALAAVRREVERMRDHIAILEVGEAYQLATIERMRTERNEARQAPRVRAKWSPAASGRVRPWAPARERPRKTRPTDTAPPLGLPAPAVSVVSPDAARRGAPWSETGLHS